MTRKWPADQVERRKVADLVPYANNARLHSDAQVEQIAKSIGEFGWTVPVLIDPKGGVIAGHGRILAAQKLGLEDVPCMVARGWTAAQKRAYVIADNKIAENAGWDENLLNVEFAALRDIGFDLSLTGFELGEIDYLLRSQPQRERDPDEAPLLPETPVSALGDLWLLGTHRLTCGDATSAETVALVLAGEQPNLMVTDPPYGVDYDPDWRNRAARKSPSMGNRYIGAGAVGTVRNDDRADWSDAWALFSGNIVYVWHGALHAGEVERSLAGAGFVIRSQIIWDKTRLIIGRGDYHWQHEPCWYAVRKGKRGNWKGDRSQTTVWQIPHQRSETGHGTQKPIDCMRRPIVNNSSPGDAVYEPFSGSGTTIIAAEMEARRCFAIELDPRYVDVAVLRWQTFTGKTATLEDGRTFDEVRAERLGAE
jgi:DNA modification methylase